LNISLKTNFCWIDRAGNVRACTHQKLITRIQNEMQR